MNTNRNPKRKLRLSQKEQPISKVSVPNEFLWALIGLLLTILSTFFEAFITNPPWNWAENGIKPQSLGVTFQVGAVLLTGCLGGKNAGALAQIAYVILGVLLGLPIFARGGGWSYLHEPSFGYILGFIPGAWLCGFLAFRRRPKLEIFAFSAACGLSVIHVCGIAYLIGLSFLNSGSNPHITPANLLSAIFNYSVVPLPGQLVIICAVSVIVFILRKILFY